MSSVAPKLSYKRTNLKFPRPLSATSFLFTESGRMAESSWAQPVHGSCSMLLSTVSVLTPQLCSQLLDSLVDPMSTIFCTISLLVTPFSLALVPFQVTGFQLPQLTQSAESQFKLEASAFSLFYSSFGDSTSLIFQDMPNSFSTSLSNSFSISVSFPLITRSNSY
jgi:hypothetical protein